MRTLRAGRTLAVSCVRTEKTLDNNEKLSSSLVVMAGEEGSTEAVSTSSDGRIITLAMGWGDDIVEVVQLDKLKRNKSALMKNQCAKVIKL